MQQDVVTWQLLNCQRCSWRWILGFPSTKPNLWCRYPRFSFAHEAVMGPLSILTTVTNEGKKITYLYYLILLFIFVLFCFFFLSVFFVERTSVILAKNTWKRKTVFCIMWSNEHFTNRQRHKKKTELSSIYIWDSTGKTHSTLCGISAKHSYHDNFIRKDNFGRILIQCWVLGTIWF